MNENSNLKLKITELNKYFINKNNISDFVKELL